MTVYGEDIPDSKVVEKILHTMSIKFGHVVTTIMESSNINILLLAESQRMYRKSCQQNIGEDWKSKGGSHEKPGEPQ